MPKRHRPTLLLRVMAELGASKIREAWIPSCEGGFVDGEIVGRNITINPMTETVDTCIHELLHKLYPTWSESYVKNRTTYLVRRLSDEEVQVIYDEYQNRKLGKKQKRY